MNAPISSQDHRNGRDFSTGITAAEETWEPTNCQIHSFQHTFLIIRGISEETISLSCPPPMDHSISESAWENEAMACFLIEATPGPCFIHTAGRSFYRTSDPSLLLLKSGSSCYIEGVYKRHPKHFCGFTTSHCTRNLRNTDLARASLMSCLTAMARDFPQSYFQTGPSCGYTCRQIKQWSLHRN